MFLTHGNRPTPRHLKQLRETGYSDCVAGVDRCDVMFQVQFLALCTSLLPFPSLGLGFHS